MNKVYKGKCRMCGKCCKVIPLTEQSSKKIDEWIDWFSKNDIEEYRKNGVGRKLTQLDNEYIFFAQNLVKITLEEAKKIIPTITGKGRVLYKCNALVDNKCSKYKERPRTCSEYPNYPNHNKTNPIGLINKIDCGYYLD